MMENIDENTAKEIMEVFAHIRRRYNLQQYEMLRLLTDEKEFVEKRAAIKMANNYISGLQYNTVAEGLKTLTKDKFYEMVDCYNKFDIPAKDYWNNANYWLLYRHKGFIFKKYCKGEILTEGQILKWKLNEKNRGGN